MFDGEKEQMDRLEKQNPGGHWKVRSSNHFEAQLLSCERFFHYFESEEHPLMFPTTQKIGGGARLPHEIIASLRLILAGPTPLRGGATQKCGAKPPRLFMCVGPRRGCVP